MCIFWSASFAEGSKNSGVSVEFTDMSFIVQTLKPFSNEMMDEAVACLYKRMMKQEAKNLTQLKICHETMKRFADL